MSNKTKKNETPVQTQAPDTEMAVQIASDTQAEMPRTETVMVGEEIYPTTEKTVSSSEDSVMARVRDLLMQPKKPGQLMTLSRYNAGGRYLYFLYEVDGDAYDQAWDLFRSVRGDNEPEFIQMVNQILNETPRMHRGVSYVPLS